MAGLKVGILRMRLGRLGGGVLIGTEGMTGIGVEEELMAITKVRAVITGIMAKETALVSAVTEITIIAVTTTEITVTGTVTTVSTLTAEIGLTTTSTTAVARWIITATTAAGPVAQATSAAKATWAASPELITTTPTKKTKSSAECLSQPD